MTVEQIKKLIDEAISKVTAFSYKKLGDTPTDALQLVPKKYVDSQITSVAAGSNTQIQYNNNGSLGANENFRIDAANQDMILGPLSPNGDSIRLLGSPSTVANQDGSYVEIVGGSGYLSGTSNGGYGTLSGGIAGSTGTGGKVQIAGGTGGYSGGGDGGQIEITGGAGIANNGNGGDVLIAGGAKHGSGVAGQIYHNSGLVTTASTYSPSAAGTATLNLADSNEHRITMPAGNITIALANDAASQKFIISITQDATGSRTVTWFNTIKWAGGAAPTLTTTASKRDTFGFIRTGSGTYDGFIIGQNI